MKKTAQQLSRFVFGALLAVFFNAGIASAATISHETVTASATGWEGFTYPLSTEYDGGSASLVTASGGWYWVSTSTVRALTTLLAYDDSTATSGTPFSFVVQYTNGGGTTISTNCVSSSYTPADLALSPKSSYSPNSALANASFFYRTISFSGADCDMLTWGPYYYRIAQIGNVAVNPYAHDSSSGVDFSFFLVTDIATSSAIYQYQNTVIGVSTSSNAVYCNSSFGSLSIGSDFANALCNVGAFLFVPDTNTMDQYSLLASTLQGKIPFSYYYDVYGIVNNSSASTSDNMNTYGLSLGLLDFSSSTAMGSILPAGNFEFFSSSTIGHFLPAGMHDLLYNMMIWAIWLDLMWLLYHKLMPAKAKI